MVVRRGKRKRASFGPHATGGTRQRVRVTASKSSINQRSVWHHTNSVHSCKCIFAPQPVACTRHMHKHRKCVTLYLVEPSCCGCVAALWILPGRGPFLTDTVEPGIHTARFGCEAMVRSTDWITRPLVAVSGTIRMALFAERRGLSNSNPSGAHGHAAVDGIGKTFKGYGSFDRKYRTDPQGPEARRLVYIVELGASRRLTR